MRTKLWKFVLFAILSLANFYGFSQDSLVVNSSFSQDTLIEINYGTQFYGLSVSGIASLNGDFSVARIIMMDSNGNEKLVFETTSQLQRIQSSAFTDYGDETYYLDGTTIDSIRIEIINATVNIQTMYFKTVQVENYQQLQDVHRNQILYAKLTQIQDYLSVNDLPWYASLTSQSFLTHEQKKAVYGEKYNICGLEYFAYGIFCDVSALTKSEPASNMVRNFDWREKHDANDPNSLYFDGNPDESSQEHDIGNGWMTALRCFECKGWCWLFGAKDHIEAYTNVYYNRHLDAEYGLNLSAQYILYNTPLGSLTDLPISADLIYGYGTLQEVPPTYSIATNYNLIPENCWPSSNQTLKVAPYASGSPCLNPDYTVSINDFHTVWNCEPYAYDNIKKDIIQRGPLGITISGHVMTLVGWGVIYPNQIISTQNPGWTPMTAIDPSSPLVGKTYWIVKQQGRLGFEGDGYLAFVSSDVSSSFFKDFRNYTYIDVPTYTFSNNPVERRYVDLDEDGIYNWGIGLVPEDCSFCGPLLDGNDNDIKRGAMDEIGDISYTLPYYTSFETSLDGWRCPINAPFYATRATVGGYSPDPPNTTDGDWCYKVIIPGNTIGTEGTMESPYFSLLDYCSTQLSFDYWFYGLHEHLGNEIYYFDGIMYVDVKEQNSSNWTTVYSCSTIDNAWDHVVINLENYRNQLIKFRIRGTDGNGMPDGELAIDNVSFTGILPDFSNPYIVTGTETFSTPTVMCTDIIINSGAKLTVTDELKMAVSGSIIVEPGGRLDILGGTVTSVGGGFWNGIKVLGNRNQNQYPIAQPVFQGMVYLSGASIENANNAISAGQWDDWNASGGVIIAYNSSFTNNRRSIEYYSYDNKIGSNVLPNRGYFYNCIFDVNDEMDTQNGLSPFKWHVTAWGVEGVQFIGCKFKNSRTDNVWSDGNTNRAIYALSANLKVTGTCSNPDSQGKIESESPDFSGFQKAIELTGCNEVYSSFIQKCSFDKNLFGVKVNTMPKVSITRNLFSLGNNEISGTPSYVHGCVGVEVEQCTGFEVEENFFDKTGTDFSAIGISTLNINLPEQINENNEIYRNRADNMDYGIQATGVNRESGQFTGVQFLCNKFYTGVSYDIDITPDPLIFNEIDAIRIFQGSYDGTVNSRKAAGNVFSSTNDLDFFQIYNECNSTINYQYNNSLNNLEYPTKISEKVIALGAYTTPIPINVAVNSCPSHISNGIEYPYTLQKKESLLAEFNSEKTAYWNLYYNYLQLIDGGSTPNVLFEIQSTWPQEAWDLRGDLLALSPFLSQEVLLEAANSGILPDAILLEIILANPDDSRGEDFLEELRSNIPNPLPEYMIEMIRNSWRTETSRTLIELGLAEHGAAKDYTFNRLMTELIYVSDSISKNYSDIRTLLSSRNELCDRYAIVDSYVAEGDFSSANSELYDIEQDYPFSERESDEHENYTNFVALLEGLYNNSKTIFEFDSTELASLESIANSEAGLSSSKARNILCFAYDLCEYNYANPSTSGTPKNSTINTAKPNEFINNLYNKVFVSPKPAHDFAEFSWDLQLLESEAMLEIYDMSGKIIYQFQITEKIGSQVWTLSGIDSGNYNYRVKENDKILASGKMTII